MIRSELIQKLAEENPNLNLQEVERIVDLFFKEIVDRLSSGGRVELRGFGAFTTRARDARTGRNPRTGEQVPVDAAVRDGAPCVEREAVRPREQRVDVEAVERDDHDRRDEEDAEPCHGKPEQARRRQISPSRQLAFTCSHRFAYVARRGMSRSRCAAGSVTARGFVSCSAFSRSLDAGRAIVFAWP